MIRTDTWLRANAHKLGINPENINPASVDVCLGEKVIEYRHESGRVRRTEEWNYYLGDKVHRREIVLEPGQTFTFRPGYFYLAHTEEYTTLPDDACAQLILKSSSGRKGLDHAHSGWGDPGFSGQWTFEFTAHLECSFRRGQRIAQLVFMACDAKPEQTYAKTGRYQGQTGVTEARPE
ncbi:dCTP deaminase, dUMP-forming [Deinococcus xinjiangensis]|uniref:dCTP deaminase, dUMP-forming n=1 Tax=Deinococcus xinjiangensis TaxID=457454 RepID=A0ABP9V6Z8_9DEIO